ncbi:hypothetical protein PMIN06_007295 [Paraphaeosphaeria minitans]
MERASSQEESPGLTPGLPKRKIPPSNDWLPRKAKFQRKRSATACQLCRTRKTKCDNNRPICSKCHELGAECIYQDQADVEPPPSQILQRLEYLIGLVESEVPKDGYDHPTHEASAGILPSLADTSETLQDPSFHSLAAEHVSTPASSAHLPQVPRHEYFGSSEDVLGWSILAGNYDRRWIEAFIFDPTLPSDDLSGTPTSPRVTDDSLRNKFEDPRQDSHAHPDIREEDVPQLVEAFLLNVHVKNPIFDPNYLRSMANAVVDRGFDWDASTCLVLTVCALAAISSTFACHPIRGINTSSDDPVLSETSLSTTPGYHMAEAYYIASRKRIGLLKDTLLATECHFMSGVYEMYSLRPLQAAISFNRACVTFQTLTWMRTEYYITESQLGKARASRLYWSCLKSEHEVSIEIRFPSSGLTKLNYTSAFPPPPSATNTEDWCRMYTQVEADSPHSTHSLWTQNEFEHGWYYYLADIAARRLLQRVIELFYKKSEVAWLEFPFPTLVHTVEELDRQLVEWHRALPGVISFDFDSTASHDELAFHLQARALEIKERIYRPFLYRMIHQKGNCNFSEPNALEPFATLHAITCSKLIQQWNVRHRHHGTWLMSRQSFACALFLLAGGLAGIEVLPVAQCSDSVQASIATLKFWEDEAPDLKASRRILQDIYSLLHEQQTSTSA